MCKLIRTYFILAVPILFIMYTKPEFTLLKGLALTDIFAAVIGALLLATILWKAYQEYWKPKRDAAKKKPALTAGHAGISILPMTLGRPMAAGRWDLNLRYCRQWKSFVCRANPA